MFRKLLFAILSAAAMTTSAVAQAPQEKSVTVVLVHGAFVDASGWKPMYDLLSNDGYQVIVVQNPAMTLDGDVAAVTSALAQARHPVLLVGHSYGGAVISQAGNNSKVAALAYITAFAPDAGESVASMLHDNPIAGAPAIEFNPPVNGFLTIRQDVFPASFAGDVDPETARFMAASQIPWGAAEGKVTAAAWHSKPTYYLIATNDMIIPPALQRRMAQRTHATISEVASSHAAMVSHPYECVRFVEAAAGAIH